MKEKSLKIRETKKKKKIIIIINKMEPERAFLGTGTPIIPSANGKLFL